MQWPARLRSERRAECSYAFAGAPFSDALTFAGVNGTLRSRTPIASNTAFEMAGGGRHAAGSPTPHGGSAGRLISSMKTSGTWGNRRIG